MGRNIGNILRPHSITTNNTSGQKTWYTRDPIYWWCPFSCWNSDHITGNQYKLHVPYIWRSNWHQRCASVFSGHINNPRILCKARFHSNRYWFDRKYDWLDIIFFWITHTARRARLAQSIVVYRRNRTADQFDRLDTSQDRSRTVCRR